MPTRRCLECGKKFQDPEGSANQCPRCKQVDDQMWEQQREDYGKSKQSLYSYSRFGRGRSMGHW